jgi:hypothetical protein
MNIRKRIDKRRGCKMPKNIANDTIYPECKFGIDDSINSIIETILEKLKSKAYNLTIVVLRLIKNH